MLIRLYSYYEVILVGCDLVVGHLFLLTVAEICHWSFVSCCLTWAGCFFTNGCVCHVPGFGIVCPFPMVVDRSFWIFPGLVRPSPPAGDREFGDSSEWRCCHWWNVLNKISVKKWTQALIVIFIILLPSVFWAFGIGMWSHKSLFF